MGRLIFAIWLLMAWVGLGTFSAEAARNNSTALSREIPLGLLASDSAITRLALRAQDGQPFSGLVSARLFGPSTFDAVASATSISGNEIVFESNASGGLFVVSQRKRSCVVTIELNYAPTATIPTYELGLARIATPTMRPSGDTMPLWEDNKKKTASPPKTTSAKQPVVEKSVVVAESDYSTETPTKSSRTGDFLWSIIGFAGLTFMAGVGLLVLSGILALFRVYEAGQLATIGAWMVGVPAAVTILCFVAFIFIPLGVVWALIASAGTCTVATCCCCKRPF